MRNRLVLRAAACGALLLFATGCQPRRQAALTGRASDEWKRSYPISPDGELQIVGANGSVDVQGGSGSTVEVRAERIAHASTDAAAKMYLPTRSCS
jgi:hypothetical protein